MQIIYVQFSDALGTSITSVFGGPQDPLVWPNQGTVDTSDPRYSEYYVSIGPLASQGLPEPTT